MQHEPITLPFSGFYNSIHDTELDTDLERAFSDHATGCDVNQEMFARAFDLVSWSYVHLEYAKSYAEAFAQEFDLPSLTFKQLWSPKFYNFETDEIRVELDAVDIAKMFNAVDRDDLRKKIKERHAHRDGFISFYPDDLDAWPSRVDEWDHNQIGTLLIAYAEAQNGEFGQIEELYLMESWQGNGGFDNAICHENPQLTRLLNIHDYLERRKERAPKIAA